MATYSFKVDSYTLLVNCRTFGHGQIRQITVQGGSSGNARTAHAAFYPGEPTAEVFVMSNGIMFAKFPLSDWDAVVDMLRNEKPVYFYGAESSNQCRFSTSDEEVGEEES